MKRQLSTTLTPTFGREN